MASDALESRTATRVSVRRAGLTEGVTDAHPARIAAARAGKSLRFRDRGGAGAG